MAICLLAQLTKPQESLMSRSVFILLYLRQHFLSSYQSAVLAEDHSLVHSDAELVKFQFLIVNESKNQTRLCMFLFTLVLHIRYTEGIICNPQQMIKGTVFRPF